MSLFLAASTVNLGGPKGLSHLRIGRIGIIGIIGIIGKTSLFLAVSTVILGGAAT